MRDYIEIGPSPVEENCVQVGSENYTERAREECKRFINLIRSKLGEEPEGAELKIKSFPHDFGAYCEVVCYYNDNNAEAINYAFRCEEEAPTRWEE